jgi:methanogenic corrinoid protein MtbC1
VTSAAVPLDRLEGPSTAHEGLVEELWPLCDRYLAAQLGGNRREALRLVVEEGLERGLGVLDIHAVVQAAQRELGRLWQLDLISVAQEHMATAISHVVLSHVYQYATPPAPNGRKVLVACVEGELHDFPARLVADALDLAGFEVRYLGGSVPTDSLLQMLDEERHDLLALSVTMTFNIMSLRAAVARVREHTGGSLPIAIGGNACAWATGLAAEVGADITGFDAQELVAAARKRLGVGP